MKILEYVRLDVEKFRPAYERTIAAIAAGDYAAAEVKKLGDYANGKLYRARLSHADRLLFTLVRYQDEVCALMLEIIANHDYASSKFLRGAAIDEEKILLSSAVEAVREAAPMRYLHPSRKQVQVLDKPISFDDVQFELFQLAAPLIIVGSAGSGKTALTLEKLKQIPGDVLYLTHSSFLAANARELYFADGVEHSQQEAQFLSFREFLETIKIPQGQEASWTRFAAWFTRIRQNLRAGAELGNKNISAHQAFEEIRGVLGARPEGCLSLAQYLALGPRQSIFQGSDRERVYLAFESYRAWLKTEQLYDLNLLAHEYLPLVQPTFDFVVIDEVQDLTLAQLALILKALRKSGQFLLSGDSNQIVHPNFFAWSQVKSLFWQDAELAARQQLRVLSVNFRNSHRATELANQLLKIKHSRFGSIDRESNFLLRASSGETGDVLLLKDEPLAIKTLDAQIRRSTQVAVIVMRDEDKAAARARFGTPLLFSVHEAKGLEYEQIVLYRFVSDRRSEFSEITAGVTAAQLTADTLEFSRAKDKSDKSLEIYKFFINALYVAVTRAVKHLYLIESDLEHELFGLLQLHSGSAQRVQAASSTRSDWQREAHKLALQGKTEQAEAIHRDVLRQAVPPWPVFDAAKLRDGLTKVFRDNVPGNKPRQQLWDYAGFYNQPALANFLITDAGFGKAIFAPQLITQHSLAPYATKNFKDVLAQCDQYGVDFRTPMNTTPLIMAAATGNIALIDALLERGADLHATDSYGRAPLHYSLLRAFYDKVFANTTFAAVYARTAPASIDLQAGARLVRLDLRQGEYLLFQTLMSLFQDRFTVQRRYPDIPYVNTKTVLEAWQFLPSAVLNPIRNKRSYLSALLARHEAERADATSRALFLRFGHGSYHLNPRLQLRANAQAPWVSMPNVVNAELMRESLTQTGARNLHIWQSGNTEAYSGVYSPTYSSAAISPAPAPAVMWAREQARQAETERVLLAKVAAKQREREQLDAKYLDIMAKQKAHWAQMQILAKKKAAANAQKLAAKAAKPKPIQHDLFVNPPSHEPE